MPASLQKLDPSRPAPRVTDLHTRLADLEVGDVITTHEFESRVKTVLQTFHRHGQKRFTRVAVVGGFFIRRLA